MSWLSWRVQRTTLLSTMALVAVFAVVAVLVKVDGPTGMAAARSLRTLGPPVFATLVAVFWGAPLVAREYEQRTYLLLWSRERPAGRWLLARVGQLLAPLVVLTIGVNAVAHLLQQRVLGPAADVVDYELWLPLQVVTVVAGFGIGLLVGVLVRGSVPAMGITLFGYVVLRLGISVVARPHLLPPVRLIDTRTPDNAIFVASGYLDRAGVELSIVDVQAICRGGHSQVSYAQCLLQNGVAHEFVDVQPPDRIPDLRLVELGVYTALAVAVLAAAWLVLRRRTTL